MKIEKDYKKGLMWLTFNKKDLTGIRKMKKKLSSENINFTITEDLYYNTVFFEVYLSEQSLKKYYTGV